MHGQGERALAIAVPRQRNRLPIEVSCISNSEQFKRHLKTFPSNQPSMTDDIVLTLKAIFSIFYCTAPLFSFSSKLRNTNDQYIFNNKILQDNVANGHAFKVW